MRRYPFPCGAAALGVLLMAVTPSARAAAATMIAARARKSMP